MLNQKIEKLRKIIKKETTPLKAKGNNRILYIDVLKLVAAFCVFFYHFAYYKLDYGIVGGGTFLI